MATRGHDEIFTIRYKYGEISALCGAYVHTDHVTLCEYAPTFAKARARLIAAMETLLARPPHPPEDETVLFVDGKFVEGSGR